MASEPQLETGISTTLMLIARYAASAVVIYLFVLLSVALSGFPEWDFKGPFVLKPGEYPFITCAVIAGLVLFVTIMLFDSLEIKAFLGTSAINGFAYNSTILNWVSQGTNVKTQDNSGYIDSFYYHVDWTPDGSIYEEVLEMTPVGSIGMNPDLLYLIGLLTAFVAANAGLIYWKVSSRRKHAEMMVQLQAEGEALITSVEHELEEIRAELTPLDQTIDSAMENKLEISEEVIAKRAAIEKRIHSIQSAIELLREQMEARKRELR